MNIETFPLIFSALSLSISLITLYRQRKHLTITFEDNIYVLDVKKAILFDGEPYPTTCELAFYTSIHIVNPSNVNMAFLDLRALNPKTNENHFIATQRTSLPALKDHPLLIKPFPDDNYMFFVTLPSRKFGPVPAGGCLSIDVLIFVNKYVNLKDGLTISIQSNDTSLFHQSPYSITNRKKYRAYTKHYDICDHQLVQNIIAQQEILLCNKEKK